MLINLQVRSSTKLQTNKPWPRILWIGKEKEDLMLLKNKVLKKLNPKNGSTKRTIHSQVKDCVVTTSTTDGGHVIGLYADGDLFSWCKDTERLFSISNDGADLCQLMMSTFKQKAKDRLTLHGNSTATRFAVVHYDETSVRLVLCECRHLERCGTQQQSFTAVGRWIEVETNDSFLRPPLNSPSLVWDCTYDPVTSCCGFSEKFFGAFVYTSSNLMHLVIVYVRFNRLHGDAGFAPVCQWRNTAVPFSRIACDCSIDTRKMYVVRWSHHGKLLAVAVNLRNANRDFIVFVSQDLKNVSVVNLPEDFSCKRHHRWVCDMAWTFNDLFLVLINRLGSICLMSRLGEPLTIATNGCFMDLPPAKFLNIHPFVYVRPTGKGAVENNECDSLTLSTDIFRQKFSVSCHPRSCQFLCSDGFMVTCVSIPDEAAVPYKFAGFYLKHFRKMTRRLKSISAICDIEPDCGEVENQLREIKPTVVGLTRGGQTPGSDQKQAQSLVDFSPDNSEGVSSRCDFARHRYGQIGDYESGTIVLGNQMPEQTVQKEPSSQCTESRKVVRAAYSIWGLLSTITEQWTVEWENRCAAMADQFITFCSNLLKRSRSFSQYKEVKQIVWDWLNVCCFNRDNQNMLVTVFRTFRTVFRQLLIWPVYNSRVECVWECAHLLALFENLLEWRAHDKSIDSTQLSSVYVESKDTLSRRLTHQWKELQKRIFQMDLKDENLIRLVWSKTSQLQKHKAFGPSSLTIGSQTLLSNPSDWKEIIESWKASAKLLMTSENSKSALISHLLHATLYTLLSNYQPKDTVKYIFWLLNEWISHGQQHLAIRKTLRSFALFLSSYITGEKLAIYPFHRPHHLSNQPRSGQRLIELDRQQMIQGIENDPLTAKHWICDVAIALFFHIGAFEEAFQLCENLGDWKTSVVIKYAEYLSNESDDCAKVIEDILVKRAITIVNNCKLFFQKDSAFKKDVAFQKDVFLPGALCGVLVTLTVLRNVMSSLANSVFIVNLPLIVPQMIKLPRPPLYWLQYELVDEDDGPPAELSEDAWSRSVSIAIQRFVYVFKTANCYVSAACHYLKFLKRIIDTTMEARNVLNYVWPLETILQRLENASRNLEDRCIDGVFRNFCAICFYLHARDKLNVSLRSIRAENVGDSYMNRHKSKDKACIDALDWATHLMCFSEEAGWDLELFQVMVSSALESPSDRRTSRRIARVFPNMFVIPRPIGLRLEPLFDRWRNTVVRVASDRRHPSRLNSKSLSAIHMEQCQEVQAASDKLAAKIGSFEERINLEQIENWKPRPFEVEEEYFKFLKVFIEITVLSDLSSENDIPLTPANKHALFIKHCKWDTADSKSRPKSTTFEQRLISDLEELQSTSSPSRVLPSRNASNRICRVPGLFRRGNNRRFDKSSVVNKPSIKFMGSRSCLQYLHELTVCDNDVNSVKNEETRRVFLWLLKWTKTDSNIIAGSNFKTEFKIKFHITLEQIWSALQLAETTSGHKMKQLSVHGKCQAISEVVPAVSSPDLEEVPCLEIKLPLTLVSDAYVMSAKSIDKLHSGFPYSYNNTEVSTRSIEVPAVDSFGIDLESLNRESDDNSIMTSSAEWTMTFNHISQSNELSSVPNDFNENSNSIVNSDLEETNLSRIVELGSRRIVDIGDTVDDISTSDELGPTELSVGDEVIKPELTLIKLDDSEYKWKTIENAVTRPMPSTFIPVLLKLDNETKESRENLHRGQTFLSKEVITGLRSKRKTKPRLDGQEKSNWKSELQLLISHSHSVDKPKVVNIINKAQPALEKSVHVSRGIQTRVKSLKEAETITNINYATAKAIRATKHEQQLAIVASTSAVDIPRIEVLSSQPKLEGKTLATQTEEFQESKYEMLIEPSDSPVLPWHNVQIEAVTKDKTEEQLIDGASSLTSAPASVTDVLSIVDLTVFKERLKSLELQGILEDTSSQPLNVEVATPKLHTMFIPGLRRSISLNDVETHREPADLLLGPRKPKNLYLENLKKQKSDPTNNISQGSLSSIDRISKVREEKRMKLRAQHFKQRKNDALRLINEMFTEEQRPRKSSAVVGRSSSLKTQNQTSAKTSNRKVHFHVDNCTMSSDSLESSSSDTLSPWIVPERVQTILSDVVLSLPSRFNQKRFSQRYVDITDQFSDGSSDGSLLE